MAIPSIFSEQGGQLNKSYSYFDLASGLGYKNFYCCASSLSTGTVYYLTTETTDAQPTSFGQTITNAGETSQSTVFDSTFQNPMTVTGTAYVNITWQLLGSCYAYITVTISHVRGATVTSLGSDRIPTLTNGAGVDTYQRENIKIDLTKKNFSIGDKIRVTITGTGRYSAGGSRQVTMYCDPASRATVVETGTGATVSTNLKVAIPFRIDL